MSSVILALILGATFVIRWFPRLRLPDSIGSDAYFHLTMARTIRENHHRIPEHVPRVLVCRPYTYPFLFHWLLSFVPEQFTMSAERLASPLIDTCYVLLTFAFAFEIDRRTAFTADPVSTALWCAALVGLSPAFLSVGPGPRAYGATPRTLGQLFFLVYVGASILFQVTHLWVWVALSSVAVAALSITTKFGNQAVVFVSIGLALAGYWVPLATALGGYVLSAIVTRGKSIRVLRGQINHSIFYFKHLQKPFLHQDRHRFSHYLRRVLSQGRKGIASPFGFARWYFSESYLFHVILVNFPHAVVVGSLLIAGVDIEYTSGISSDAFGFMLWITGVSFFLSCLISLKPLMFLGEAPRYAEHTVMVQVILCVVLVKAANLDALLWLVLGYSLVAYWFSVENYLRLYGDSEKVKRDLPPLIQGIDVKGTNIFWAGHLFWPLLFFTRQASILIHGANFGERLLAKEDWFIPFGNFPFPGRPMAEVVARYNIDYLIGMKAGVAYYEKLLNDRPFSEGRFKKIAAVGDLELYSTRGQSSQESSGT